MNEIKFYGRGGQGAVVASVLLANAAFKEGKHVQAFPFYGIERRGAPVAAYTRIDDKPIRSRGQIKTPDVAVVLDTYLVGKVDITQGLKPGGIIILNTDKDPKFFDFSGKFKTYACDANAIAVKHKLGTAIAPIANTTILGALAKATGLVKLESIISVFPEKISVKLEDNIQAAKEAFDTLR